MEEELEAQGDVEDAAIEAKAQAEANVIACFQFEGSLDLSPHYFL